MRLPSVQVEHSSISCGVIAELERTTALRLGVQIRILVPPMRQQVQKEKATSGEITRVACNSYYFICLSGGPGGI